MSQVLIIGAGLAGLTAAIELAGQDCQVTVMEKKELPRHKVCGEYLSREVLPYLEMQHINLPERPIVDQFLLSTASGRYVQRQLPLGGIGISRKTLDTALYKRAMEKGAKVLFHTKVQEVKFNGDYFDVVTSKGDAYKTKVVLATFGKGPGWHAFKEVKDRKKPVYLGVKQYYKHSMPDDLVVLHNFRAGYCGAVKVEDETIDVAYMVRQDVFRQYKDTALMEQQLLHVNPFLKHLLTKGEPVLKNPLTISNFQLGSRKWVKDHILYAGDAAAMIPPASGNGMAMAIWGGRHAARSIELYLRQRFTREKMEQHYKRSWRKHLGRRLFWGRQFQHLMGKGWPSELAMFGLKTIPGLLPYLVSLTHAKSSHQFDQ